MKIGSDYTENNGLIIGEDGLARPAWAAHSELLRDYYDTEWGMPVRDEQGLFERLSLEVFQAGLSWETVLKKRPAFQEAFANSFSGNAANQFPTLAAREHECYLKYWHPLHHWSRPRRGRQRQ